MPEYFPTKIEIIPGAGNKFIFLILEYFFLNKKPPELIRGLI